VFVAVETLLVRRGRDLAIDDKRRRRVVPHGAAQAQHDHGASSEVTAEVAA
jgi:hypothetical protein